MEPNNPTARANHRFGFPFHEQTVMSTTKKHNLHHQTSEELGSRCSLRFEHLQGRARDHATTCCLCFFHPINNGVRSTVYDGCCERYHTS